MKKYVKFMLNEFANDSRNMREIDSIESLFDETVVFCPQISNEYVNKTRYKVITYKHELPKSKFIRRFNILFYILFKIPLKVRRLKPYIISCQDLTALLIGWISTLFIPKSRKPILVYDSHELEIARNTNGKRTKFASKFIQRLEKFLIKKAAFSIFACDSAAIEVQKLYKLVEKPLVVRNVPYKWEIDDNEVNRTRKELLSAMNLKDPIFLLLHHGNITNGRGIETLIQSIEKINDVALVIMGMGNKDYIDELIELAIKSSVKERVGFFPAVPVDELKRYVGVADVGMITIHAVTKSYYYMLPNKFFENIQARNPIICSNFPEVKKIIDEYDIGLTVDPESINEITQAILEMKNNKSKYNKFIQNLEIARNELCWENESPILFKKYKKTIDKS